jgi:hypothetical protein
VKKRTKIVLVTVGFLFAALCCTAFFVWKSFTVTRKSWKEKAIAEINGRLADPKWLADEIEKVKAQTRADVDYGWYSDEIILMENSEWLAYRSHCGKRPPHHIADIFLARGSDGKWYYSTFHFCVGMCVLRMEQNGQPTALAKFARKFFLREFDGKSDECLKETWPFGARYHNTPFMSQAENALAGIKTRCAQDPILKPISGVQAFICEPRDVLYWELKSWTQESWDGIATRADGSPYRVYGEIWVRIGEDAGDEPWTPVPFAANRFCNRTVWETDALHKFVVLHTLTGDSDAHSRLTKIVSEELAKQNIHLVKEVVLPKTENVK